MSLKDIPLAELSRRCLESRQENAWFELIHRLQPVFARVVYRVATNWAFANRPEVDDIIQEICLKLGARGGEILRRVPLESEESALAYLKVMAANTARDYLKAKSAQKRGASQTTDSGDRMDELAATVSTVDRMETQILFREVNAALNVDARERTIFWLYYRQGFTAKEIAAVQQFALSEKGVESMIHRLTVAARQNLRSSPGSAPDTQNRPKGNSAPEAL